ncbi:LysR family transcriptional regulator [Reinekea sp.]|jgi:DNA-binding transcriptional LysR family regulator|uniref:LysR family transcriptional regulator n=1 Tax=Reinekea sp. TaxID=1970455 RepID=UPI002A81E83F|nr:LysR family transcriptional regulator [Reinekea sp.]
MDQLRALNYFIAVAESGNFTEAARRFSVPASSISRRIADLEHQLGATLFQRSTRVVRLTEVGRNYLKQVQPLVAQLAQTNESVRTYQTEPMGTLRISSMVGFGELVLLPLLDEFSMRYPKVLLDISLTDELSTLNRDDIDIAIRGGYAPNERVVAIKLLDNRFFPVAAPTYLARAGVPEHPAELRRHAGLYFRTPAGPTPWLSHFDQQWQDVSGPAVAISNHGAWLMAKTLAGEGIVLLPKWVTQPYLDRGELVLLDLQPTVTITSHYDSAVFLLYQKHRYLVPKIKRAVDFLVARIAQTTAIG